jgi:hypothetical protein
MPPSFTIFTDVNCVLPKSELKSLMPWATAGVHHRGVDARDVRERVDRGLDVRHGRARGEGQLAAAEGAADLEGERGVRRARSIDAPPNERYTPPCWADCVTRHVGREGRALNLAPLIL